MKEFYTKQEQILIDAVKLLDAKKVAAAALALDALLLDMEEKLGLMDGLKMEEWTL